MDIPAFHDRKDEVNDEDPYVWEDVVRAQSGDTEDLDIDQLFNTRSCPPGPEQTFEELQKAILNGQMVQAVQPGYPIENKYSRYPDIFTVPYLELLVRAYVNKVLIGPGQFLPEIWKNQEIMRTIFARSLHDACLMANHMQAEGRICVVGVNAGEKVLSWREFVPTTIKMLGAHKTSPDRLGLEIFEDVKLKVMEHALKNSLPFLAEQGVRISIDDYPDKNSKELLSMMIQKKVPVFAVKISGSVLKDLSKKPEQLLKIWSAQDHAVEAGAHMLIFEGGPGVTVQDVNFVKEMYMKVRKLKWFFQSPRPAQPKAA